MVIKRINNEAKSGEEELRVNKICKKLQDAP